MWKKTPEELRQALSAPFANGDIEWRVSATSKNKDRGLAVPYVTNRAIQNRLDDTVGVDGWYNDFRPWKNDVAQLCGISIYFSQEKQWLTKWDGADDSDFESVKGGLSDSMKRAAVEWGIGRYLYGMTQVWVGIEARGKGYAILDAERSKLDKTHEQWVTYIQGKAGNTAPQGEQTPDQTEKPQQNSPAPEQRQDGQPQTTPSQKTAPASQGNNGAPTPTKGVPEGCFQVQGSVIKPTLSGAKRLHLQLLNSAGQVFQAFQRGEPDGRLAPGAIVSGAEFSTNNNRGVTFYVLERYQVMDSGMNKAA